VNNIKHVRWVVGWQVTIQQQQVDGSHLKLREDEEDLASKPYGPIAP
jgi:hypothetical protein